MKKLLVLLSIIVLTGCVQNKEPNIEETPEVTSTPEIIATEVPITGEEGFDYPFDRYTTYVCPGNEDFHIEYKTGSGAHPDDFKYNVGNDEFFWVSLQIGDGTARDPEAKHYFGLGFYDYDNAEFLTPGVEGWDMQTGIVAGYEHIGNQIYKITPWVDVSGNDSTIIPLYFEFKDGVLSYPVSEDLSFKNVCELRIPERD